VLVDIGMYTDKATREYEEAIKNAYLESEGPLFDGPVNLNVTFNKDKVLITISAIEGESSLRGDIDNYLKSIMDGLNGVAYHDDGQVLSLKAFKR
jgi:Holliday junction resolvase RusA-like endonuclease